MVPLEVPLESVGQVVELLLLWEEEQAEAAL
jgi:hypothetical protein